MKNPKNKHLYKICPNCHFFCHFNEEDEFCSLCGTRLITECPNCSKEIHNPYAKYCKSCGNPIPGRADKIDHNTF